SNGLDHGVALAPEFFAIPPSCSRQEAIEYARERARVRLLVEIGNPARHLIPTLPEPLTDFEAERPLLALEIDRQVLPGRPSVLDEA
ncbi:MAG: hypothetical protein JF606_28885, partial [Burkholderiales bacterium]|nr:hypothetical protein [Burkholderiales bacterium]